MLAPVVIPTLNRYDKLKACIDSLELCTLADKTDVYVALDFPPSEKYVLGWKKCNEYLEKKETDNGFLSFTVVRRNTNFGVCHKNSNANALVLQLKDKYDRFIFTEDDNVFSPNFLVFLNKGLDRFYNDDRIFVVCGYNYPMVFPKSYRNNYYISKHGSPWGYGMWYHKMPDYEKYCDLDYLGGLLKDDKSLRFIKDKRPSLIGSIINMLKDGRVYGDSAKGCYVIFEDKYWLMPVSSKVQNHGTDGTGVHSRSKNEALASFYSHQCLDKEDSFFFTDDVLTMEPPQIEKFKAPEKWYKHLYKELVTRLDLFLYRHFDFVPKTKYL